MMLKSLPACLSIDFCELAKPDSSSPSQIATPLSADVYKVCSALDPDKGTELELTVYTLTVHDGGVNQGLWIVCGK